MSDTQAVIFSAKSKWREVCSTHLTTIPRGPGHDTGRQSNGCIEWHTECVRVRACAYVSVCARNMRVARQHPLHLQVSTRTNNGKFLVGTNNSQDVVHQQPSPQQQQHSTSDESSAVVPGCVFPSCESVPTDLHGSPTILGDRFLLLGPAEGSALYRCVDVHNDQQLVAKVRLEIPLQISSSFSLQLQHGKILFYVSIKS